jgi:hypothetical protein
MRRYRPGVWFIATVGVYARGNMFHVGFEVLTAVAVSSVFWYIMPCSPVEVDRSFGRIYGFHIQGWRVSDTGNHHEAGSKQSSAQRYVTRKCLLAFTGFHGVVSQKVELLIVTLVRTRLACCLLRALSCVSYFLTLKMEAACSSKTSVECYHSPRLYIILTRGGSSRRWRESTVTPIVSRSSSGVT